ncbi:CocE/NonD family hydrolase [Ideonella alba]|uniref:Prolyl oligopeptidase family serine peptidase n=1 Tax=Ideonella alba TaxID=2824118 RepID=A0A940Y6A0_9BURK|nr:CocE/NonD family hydrolase [Ideonella alba]MBQ0929481.1 prolyl oligopeptidase family serine peptidase [Ideonella alba]
MSPFSKPLAALLAPLLWLASHATAAERPWVQGQRTVPYFANAIKETVLVDTGFDRDNNGVVDTIRVEITRPETAPGVRLPLIIHASPYYFKRSRGAWEPAFFSTRGYAVATVALPGTDFSTGCDDVGGDFEVKGTKAVIDWANGRAVGRYLDGSTADATQWTNGQSGMIGVSWDGTIANAVASTGVKGLKTIVPVAAISSWYDYTRSHGIPYYTEHVRFLHEYVSNFDSSTCSNLTPELQARSDDLSGSYNRWWSVRDFRLDASKITASVFVVHGLTDENVKTGQFGLWWDELARHGVARRLFLHQGQHVEPYSSFGSTYTTPLLAWFDHYLQGLDNGIPTAPQAIIQRENGTWSTDATWPPEGTTMHTLKLSAPLARRAPALSTASATVGTAERYLSFTQSSAYSTDSIVSNPTQARSDRLVFLSNALAAPLRLAGTTTVTLRVQVNQPTAGLQARVVDYNGSSAYVVTRTMADVGHHRSLSVKKTLVPGEWYTISWTLNTDDRIFATAHNLGIVISAEQANPLIAYQPVTVTVDTQRSSVTMPLLGDLGSLASVKAVAPISAATIESPMRLLDREEFIREFVEGSR